MTDAIHVPVLLERCAELLAPAVGGEGAVLVDATLGLGGHAEAMLERHPRLTLVGLDRDRDALERAGRRLERFGRRVRLVHSVYDDIAAALDAADVDRVQGVLFDLGVSSLQLDSPARGFSYAREAPLDMRMDADGDSPTARSVLAGYDVARLARVFELYGEERLALRYARALVAARERRELTTTSEVVAVLQEATPAALKADRHPAKRVFQALRIEVNGELAALERALPAAVDALALGGRIVVLAYQSLEDRIVKAELTRRSRSTAPARLPVELPEHRPELALLTRGAERAGEDEARVNPRALPVRLRAAERVRSVA